MEIKSYKDLVPAKRKDKWQGHILRLHAERMMANPIIFEEAVKIDMTTKLFKEIHRQLENREIVKTQINAKPRMAKSTIAIGLGVFMKMLLEKMYPELVYKKGFTLYNICRDDQEYTKRMRNPKLMYEVLVVDEDNALQKTGENATTEKAQKDDFSNIQAGRYVHTIYVCPEGDMDDNTDIKLEVRNKEKGMSLCYLYYNLKGSWILLGHVNFDVRKLIANWMKVEKRFFKWLKHGEEKDRKYIDYWKKKDFYVEYMVEKYAKMDLMNKEGIIRPRELDYAEVVQSVIEKTRNLVKVMSVKNLKNPVMSYVEIEMKGKKIPYSMIGIEQATKRVMSFLILLASQLEIKKAIHKLKKGTHEDKGELIADLCSQNEDLVELIGIQEDELERYAQLNRKYNKYE